VVRRGQMRSPFLGENTSGDLGGFWPEQGAQDSAACGSVVMPALGRGGGCRNTTRRSSRFHPAFSGWDGPVARQPPRSPRALPSGGLTLAAAAAFLCDESSVAPFGEGAECCLSEILAASFCVDLGARRLAGLSS